MVEGSGVGSISGTSTRMSRTFANHCCLTSERATSSGEKKSDKDSTSSSDLAEEGNLGMIKPEGSLLSGDK
jgi:hypothetical protein